MRHWMLQLTRHDVLLLNRNCSHRMWWLLCNCSWLLLRLRSDRCGCWLLMNRNLRVVLLWWTMLLRLLLLLMYQLLLLMRSVHLLSGHGRWVRHASWLWLLLWGYSWRCCRC